MPHLISNGKSLRLYRCLASALRLSRFLWPSWADTSEISFLGPFYVPTLAVKIFLTTFHVISTTTTK